MKCLFSLVLLMCFNVLAAEKHKHQEHAAHEHGSGKLDIIFESNVLNFELNSPAFDFVGFETKANTEANKKNVLAAYNKLKDFKNVIETPKKADCKLNQFKLEGKVFEGVEGVTTTPSSAPASAPGTDKDQDHSEVTAFYSLQCYDRPTLKGSKITIFKSFPKMKNLKVQTVIEGKQGSFKATSVSNNITGF